MLQTRRRTITSDAAQEIYSQLCLENIINSNLVVDVSKIGQIDVGYSSSALPEVNLPDSVTPEASNFTSGIEILATNSVQKQEQTQIEKFEFPELNTQSEQQEAEYLEAASHSSNDSSLQVDRPAVNQEVMIRLGDNASYARVARNLLQDIYQAQHSINYEVLIESLAEEIAEIVEARMRGLIKHKVINPITSHAVQYGVSKLVDWARDHPLLQTDEEKREVALKEYLAKQNQRMSGVAAGDGYDDERGEGIEIIDESKGLPWLQEQDTTGESVSEPTSNTKNKAPLALGEEKKAEEPEIMVDGKGIPGSEGWKKEDASLFDSAELAVKSVIEDYNEKISALDSMDPKNIQQASESLLSDVKKNPGLLFDTNKLVLSCAGELYDTASQQTVYALKEIPGGKYILAGVGVVYENTLGRLESAISDGVSYLLDDDQTQQIKNWYDSQPHGIKVLLDDGKTAVVTAGVGGALKKVGKSVKPSIIKFAEKEPVKIPTTPVSDIERELTKTPMQKQIEHITGVTKPAPTKKHQEYLNRLEKLDQWPALEGYLKHVPEGYELQGYPKGNKTHGLVYVVKWDRVNTLAFRRTL